MIRIFLFSLLFGVSSVMAQLNDPAFRKCLKSDDQGRLGELACYSKYLDRLRQEQSKLIGEIQLALSGEAPEGKDFVAAKTNFKRSQAAWRQYVKADCDLDEDLFGIGTGGPASSMTCQLSHYAIRNKQLVQLRKSVS